MFRMKFVAESRELVGDFWIVQCVPLTLGLDSAVREYSSGRKKCFFEKKLEKVEVNNILIENESVLCYFFNDELLKDILNFDRYMF